MLVFKVGRAYRFQCADGEFVGTFVGKRKGKLVFTDLTHIIDSQHINAKLEVASNGILDAEPWHSEMPFTDTGFLSNAKRVIKRVRSEKRVAVKNCTTTDNF